MKKYLLLLVAVIVAVSFSGCVRVSINSGSTDGDMAVYFSTTALDGTTVTQDFFKDHKVNFVHYWATWCGPCTGELPEMPELYEKYKDKVGFIAVVDPEGIETAQQILTDSKVTFLNVNTFPEIANILGTIEYVPCTILVNDRGVPMTEQIVGAVGIEKYSVYIDDALAKAEGQ